MTLAAAGLVVMATSGFSCGSGDGESTTGGAGGAAAGAGGATGGAGGVATGGAGGASTGGAGGMAGATGGMGGMAMGGMAGGSATGAPMSCKFGAKDNPNKAEVSWTIEGASADANVMKTSFSGETRVLVTYIANPALKMMTWGFGVPYVGLTPPPCVSFGATLGGIDAPAAGKTVMAMKGIIPQINFLEDPTCTGNLLVNGGTWSLSDTGSVTFTKVEGPNIEFDFSFPMAGSGKPDAKGKGSFTIKGHVKSPCYFIEP